MNTTIYRILYTLVLFLSYNALFAQTGPGGVGNASGTPGQPQNVIWFDASSLSLSDTEPVATWTDLSGNGNDADQTDTDAQPTFLTGQINGLPAVQFDGTDDFMPFDGSLITNTDYTVIFVGKRRTDDAQRVFLGGTTSSANQNLHLYWENSNQFRAHHYGNDLQTDMVDPATVPDYSSGTETGEFGIFSTLLASSDASDQRRNYQNNHFLGSRSDDTQLSSYSGAAIGRYNSGFHDVDAAEIIIYSNALNDAQLQIVHQYLNIKYGIVTDNDLFSPDGTYITDIAGIGKASSSDEHTHAESDGMHISGLSDLNSDDYLFTAHNNAANSSSDFTGANLDDAELRYNRIWEMQKTNTPAARIAFDFSEAVSDGKNPVNIENYVLLFRSGTSGTFSTVKTADGIQEGDQVYFDLAETDIQDGYYTFGTTDNTESPLQGTEGKTWYSLVTGDWDDWETWTLDPSGALPDNPDKETPTTSTTNTADKVVILTGKTVTISSNDKINAGISVEGRLELGTTTGHSFTEIKGNGRIVMETDNFPTGDETDFVSAGQGEGTVVYEGDSYDLSTLREFYDMEVNLNAGQTISLLNDYTINGKLTVKNGTLQINDETDDRKINLTINGNLTVQSGASITTGTGNPFATDAYSIQGGNMPADADYHNIYHQLTIGGDFQNDGTVRFTNLSAPLFNEFATDGAVTVTFTGAANNKMTLNGQTDFYNLIVDKGVNKNYELELYSSNISNFILYGANSVGRITSGSYSTADPLVRKALFIKTGTLKLTGNVDIPTLSEGDDDGGNGDYAIGQNARLWIAGSNATVYSTASAQSEVTGFETTAQGVDTGSSNQALSLFGEFRISDGFFGTRNSAGFIFWSDANSQVKIEGGTVNVAQMRSSNSGSGQASYTQSGGLVEVRGDADGYAGEVSGSRPIFGFASSTGVFNMSGGELLIKDTGGSTTNGFYIPSAEGNYNVTGGTVTIRIASGNDFEIGSTAPVWDLNIEQLSGTGTSIVRLTSDLTVADDLSIDPNCRLDVQDDEDNTDYDLYIGDDFNFRSDAEFYARNSTTHFIGSSASTIRIYDTTTEGDLTFNNLTISKEQNWNPDTYDQVITDGHSRTTGHPVEIQGNLLIERGDFNTGDYEVDIHGNIQVDEGKITNGTGKIVLNGTSQQTLEGPQTQQLEFGSLELLNNAGALLLSDIAVTDFILTTESDGSGTRIVDLDTYNLDVSGDLTINNGSYSSDVMYKTAGNAGDGGITRLWDLSTGGAGTTILFPLGSGSMYTPATIRQSETISDQGKFTVNPVNDYHPALKPGEENKTIPYYWVVDTAEFSSVNYDQIQYEFEYPGPINGGVKRGANLWDQDWSWYDMGNVLSGSTLVFPYSTYLTLDFALGNPSIFKTPEVYYTRDNAEQADWKTNDTWVAGSDLIDANGDGDINSEDWHDSRQPAAGSYPQAGDIAVIGWVPWDDPKTSLRGQPHSARWNGGDLDCAVIQFTQMLDKNGDPTERVYRNEFQFRPTFTINSAGAMNIGKIQGEGIIRVRDQNDIDPDFSTTDISGFTSQDSAYFLYEAFSNKTYNNAPGIYPNLFISNDGWGANDRDVTINKNIIVFGNFEVRGNANYVLPTGTDGDVEIYGDLIIAQDPVSTGGAEFAFGNTGNDREITVYGDLLLSGEDAKIWVRNPENTDIADHIFNLYGNITQNTTGSNDIIRFWTANDEDRVSLNIPGNQSAEYTRPSGTAPDLYRIIMNKEAASEWVAFNFMDDFTLGGPTDGDEKAIELISGRLGLRDPGIDVTLTSGGADFKIPAEAKLWLGSSATARVSGDNTGIWLDGQLDIGYGVDALFNEGTNNYIEYTASGTSEIYINGGSSKFYVGSQIRRSTTTEEGILNFKLTSETSDVRIGTNAGNIPENNRGVFEILNTGSNLEMSDNTTIIIANAQDNPLYPAVYLDPETSTLGTGSSIQFGNDNTAATQTIGLFSNINLKNIDVINSAASTDPTAKIWYQGITVDENISIASGTELDAAGWDITLNGDWSNSGNFTANGNTVYFSGSNAQAISGNTSFYNFTKTTNNQVSINNAISIENTLNIQDGILADGGNTITVLGDINNDGTHDWGDTGLGLYLNGTTQQTINTSGVFGKITLDNTSGAHFPTEAASIVIDDAVEFRNGVLDIGKNLMELDEDAVFIEAAGYSENNMIQTNLSFTDNGVKKEFPAITATTEFIFPIGSEGKYTPIELSIDNIDAGGSIRVKAADEIQSTITDDNDECNEFDDTQNVLQYHWVMDAENVSNFTATALMRYYEEDALFDNTHGYDLSDYITARLLEGGNAWNKYDNSSFDEDNQTLEFYFNNTDTEGISGDYTAGIEQETGCNGAIPNEVPMYISIKDGPWNQASTWETYPDGDPGPAGGPRGAIVIIDDTHTVTATENYILNYKTEIRSGGTLAINTTFGHRLGLVSGGGTLYMQRGDLPAAVFDNFIYEDLGTFEFGGSDNYDILSELPSVHSLKLSGTGERRFPNLNLTIRGELIITGDAITLNAINEHNETINVRQDITFNNGTFEAGTGDNAVFVIDGNTRQTITGTNAFTGSNAFNHFEMNNSSGVTLEKPVEIDENLTFTTGVINTDATNTLTLNSATEGIVSGAGSGSYVNGPLIKNVALNGNFEFPTGNAGRYGKLQVKNADIAGNWEAQYYNDNPVNASDPESMDPTVTDGTLKGVSDNEYWRVKGPAGADAQLMLRWDSQNNGFASNTDDMRIAEWRTGSPNAWTEYDASPTADGDNTSGTITADETTGYNEFTNGNFFTLASVYAADSFTWDGTTDSDWNTGSNWSGGSVPGPQDDIVIPSDPASDPDVFPVISSAVQARIIDLQAGATLTVNPNASLTTGGDFQLDGTLILKSPAADGDGSDASGSFIDNGTINGTGSIQAERYMTGGFQWHYISVPVGGVDSDFFTDHPEGFNSNFKKYNESYDLDEDPATAPEGSFDSDNLVQAWEDAYNEDGSAIALNTGQGYSAADRNNKTVIFEGTPNTGNYSVDGLLSYTENDPTSGPLPNFYDGWNLIGNPYPSSIDWKQVAGAAENIDNAVYLWDGAQYISYVNGVSGNDFDGKIAPMQGFFVHASGENPTLTFDNSHRVHSSRPFYKNSEEPSGNQLELMLEGSGYQDVAVIYTHPKASSNFDGSYDAYKVFSNYPYDVPHVYTQTEDGMSPLSINALGTEDENEHLEIPVNIYVVNSGTYKLSLKNFSQLENFNLYFEDKQEGTYVPVADMPKITVNHTGGKLEGRFVLHKKANKAPVAVGEVKDKQYPEKEAFSFTLSEQIFEENDFGDSIANYQTFVSGKNGLPEFLSFDNKTLTFTGEAQNEDVGIYELTLEAFDTHGASASIKFSLEILNVNDAPQVQNAPDNQEGLQDEYFEFILPENTFTDIDPDDQLKYSASEMKNLNLPEWLTFDAEQRKFYGTPGNEHIGTSSISITAEDLAGETASTEFKLEVINVNDAPILQGEISDQTIDAGNYFSLFIDDGLFTDIDPDDRLSYDAIYGKYADGDEQNWLKFSESSMSFFGTPDNSDAGSFTITIKATDRFGEFAETQFNLTVKQTTGLDETNSENVVLYPNPAKEGFYISTGKTDAYRIKVTDIKGRVIKELNFNSDQHYVPADELASGMYIIELTNQNESQFLKLFIE